MSTTGTTSGAPSANRHMCGDNEECDYLNFHGGNLVCADCDGKLDLDLVESMLHLGCVTFRMGPGISSTFDNCAWV